MNDPTVTDLVVTVSQVIRETLGGAKLTEVPDETLYAVHRIVWAWDNDLAMEIRRRRADKADESRVDEVLAERQDSAAVPHV